MLNTVMWVVVTHIKQIPTKERSYGYEEARAVFAPCTSYHRPDGNPVCHGHQGFSHRSHQLRQATGLEHLRGRDRRVRGRDRRIESRPWIQPNCSSAAQGRP